MPRLPLTEFQYPETLFGAGPPAANPWCILHTKPRTEKALARRLIEEKVPFFLPLYARKSKTSQRVRTSYLPLFTGYLFFRGSREQRLTAYTTNYIANLLEVPNQEKLHQQLHQVQRIMLHDAEACQPNITPTVGSLVEITQGPFIGMTGRVIELAGGFQFVVEIEFLGQGVAITVEPYMFRRAD
jgi:transcription antitermination factor NusG